MSTDDRRKIMCDDEEVFEPRENANGQVVAKGLGWLAFLAIGLCGLGGLACWMMGIGG